MRSQAVGPQAVRSQAATAKAVAGALSQSTGLAPSQVTAQATCASTRPGTARCDAETLVLRAGHARVRPHVEAGPSFTQVFPAARRGIASVRPATAAASPPQAGTPAWLQQAYDLTYLSQTRGTGDTVAIVDAYDDPTAESDLAYYRSTFGLPACTTANGCFKKVNQTGQQGSYPAPDSGWAGEESLDLDAVSALCPNCHILLVEANNNSDPNLAAAVSEAAALNANQISNSWSDDAPSPMAGTFTFSGTAVIAATGDSGYVGGGDDAYPAAIPGVTAAGGTSLAPAAGGQSARGFGESAWSLYDGWGASSGCDPQESRPSYQPAGGCAGRAYSDVSADADPLTGLIVYDDGGWGQYGGTSLASPLIAAYEAITGVAATDPSPHWAYSDSALLNDPTTGSSGDCPLSILYVCDAGPGYDGPTGIGSISGAVVAGAPGIGGPSFGDGIGNTYTAGLGTTSATLSGGVYPNGLDTTYYWQYGPTTSYGGQTASVDAGAGQAPAVATAALAGLAPGTTYHYRLVAQNVDGVTYGYDSTLTTGTAPVDVVSPSIAGTAAQGHALYAYSGGWSPAGNSFSYQWQNSADGVNWADIAGATGGVYTVAASDAGDYLRVMVTATGTYGQAAAASAPAGPVPSAPGLRTLPRISADPGRVGDVLKITRGTWGGSPVRADVTRVMRCTNTCVAVGAANATRYAITPADVGAVLWVQETATNAAGTAVVWSAGSVGPVRSASSGAVSLSGGRTALRSARGAKLASVKLGSQAANGKFGPLRTSTRTLQLRRARGVKGQVIAWVCPVAVTPGGPPPACTARISVGAHTTVRLPASMTGRIRIVVVRRTR